MDQQAKKHLQDEFDAALEEKDQMITVLQTQVTTWMEAWICFFFFLCGAKSAAVAFGIYTWLIKKEIEMIKKQKKLIAVKAFHMLILLQ